MRCEVAHELRDVPTRCRQTLDSEQGGLRVVVAERLGGVEDQLRVGYAEHLEHVVELHLSPAVGDQLLERAERVAEAAGRRSGDHPERGVGNLDRLLRGDAP